MAKYIVFVLLILTSCGKITFEEHRGTPPVDRINVTKRSGHVDEMFLFLQPNVRLTNVIDLQCFATFQGQETLEDAKRERGEPDFVKHEKEMGCDVSLYEVQGGVTGFMLVPGSGGKGQWQVWAYPSNSASDIVLMNPALRNQIFTHVTNDSKVRVRIDAPDQRGVTLGIRSNRVEYMVRDLP